MTAQQTNIKKEDFVKVMDYIPDIHVDLKYATEDNFTGHKIYDFADAYLRYGTVQKLVKVQEGLRKQGLSLKIWDAYRPPAAQFIFWEICPDDNYVANPIKGFSPHSRGGAVDVCLVTANGEELEMPTEFDDFSGKAIRDYSLWTPQAGANLRIVEELMVANGFTAYEGEWWHYVDLDKYPVEEHLQIPVVEE